ncbi:MAG TPA: hypothetical protein PKC83_17335 [Gemmatimonadaceae bacterium]|nr:hypothetical protein [Gemmatimonadaceae bacterium]
MKTYHSLPGSVLRTLGTAGAGRRSLHVAVAGAVGLGMALATAVAAQAPRPRVKFRAYPVEVALDTLVFARDTVAAPMGETFAAVRATYAALKLPREWADSANGQLGTLRARMTYRLGGERLSVYFNCGQGLTGANADTWRLTIAMVTFLQPASDGRTRVGTGLVAEAQDMSGTSVEPAMCGSTGLLEERILKDVRARLGRG